MEKVNALGREQPAAARQARAGSCADLVMILPDPMSAARQIGGKIRIRGLVFDAVDALGRWALARRYPLTPA